MGLVMYRGDTRPFNITVTEVDGVTPFDLSGCTLWLTAKRSPADADADAIFQLSTTGGEIVITDAANGEATATPTPTDTLSLTDDTSGVYDVQVETPAGAVYTVAYGDILITRDITRTYTP